MLARISGYHHQSPDRITVEQIKEYLQYCKQEKGYSTATINQTISAIRILHQDVLGNKWEEIRIKRLRTSRQMSPRNQ